MRISDWSSDVYSSDLFAIVTLGFGEIIRIVLINWYDVTNGPDGISGIPRPNFFGVASMTRNSSDGLPPFHEYFGLEYSSEYRIIFLYYLILVLAEIGIATVREKCVSPFRSGGT